MAGSWDREQNDERLSPADSALLSQGIAHLTEAGLPLGPGLRALSDELRQEVPRGGVSSLFGPLADSMFWLGDTRERQRIYRCLRRLADAIDSGTSVPEALDAQGTRVPRPLRGLLAIGARTGQMSQVLNRYAEYVTVGSDLNRQLLISLVYPFLAFMGATLVIITVCWTLINSFSHIYRDFGVPLPTITVVLIGFANLFELTARSLFELFFGVALIVLFLAMLGPATRRSLMASIPMIGKLWRYTSLAEFCHLLALLLDSSIPLPEALAMVGDGVNDSALDRAAKQMSEQVAEGNSLAKAISSQRVFPRSLSQVLHWAEQQQSLPDALRMTGDIYAARTRTHAQFAGAMLSFLTLFIILMSVATVVFGLLLPMINLIARLSG